MTNAFTVSGLTKTYQDFVLDQVSFSVPSGSIVGLVLLINLFIPVKENILSAFNIVFAISNLWFFISYRVAVTVYQKRDIT